MPITDGFRDVYKRQILLRRERVGELGDRVVVRPGFDVVHCDELPPMALGGERRALLRHAHDDGLSIFEYVLEIGGAVQYCLLYTSRCV